MTLTEQTLNQFLNTLASNAPAPGGGSVSALAAALGAGLTSMVCHLTIGKKKYLDVESEMKTILERTDRLRSECAELIDLDTAAFNKVMEAFALPKETDEQKSLRSNAIQAATMKATEVPLAVMRKSAEAIALVKTVAEKGNVNSISDAGVAALMIRAAMFGAKLNVQINISSIRDQQYVHMVGEEVLILSADVETETATILSHINRVLKGNT